MYERKEINAKHLHVITFKQFFVSKVSATIIQATYFTDLDVIYTQELVF